MAGSEKEKWEQCVSPDTIIIIPNESNTNVQRVTACPNSKLSDKVWKPEIESRKFFIENPLDDQEREKRSVGGLSIGGDPEDDSDIDLPCLSQSSDLECKLEIEEGEVPDKKVDVRIGHSIVSNGYLDCSANMLAAVEADKIESVNTRPGIRIILLSTLQIVSDFIFSCFFDTITPTIRSNGISTGERQTLIILSTVFSICTAISVFATAIQFWNEFKQPKASLFWLKVFNGVISCILCLLLMVSLHINMFIGKRRENGSHVVQG